MCRGNERACPQAAEGHYPLESKQDEMAKMEFALQSNNSDPRPREALRWTLKQAPRWNKMEEKLKGENLKKKFKDLKEQKEKLYEKRIGELRQHLKSRNLNDMWIRFFLEKFPHLALVQKSKVKKKNPVGQPALFLSDKPMCTTCKVPLPLKGEREYHTTEYCPWNTDRLNQDVRPPCSRHYPVTYDTKQKNTKWSGHGQKMIQTDSCCNCGLDGEMAHKQNGRHACPFEKVCRTCQGKGDVNTPLPDWWHAKTASRKCHKDTCPLRKAVYAPLQLNGMNQWVQLCDDNAWMDKRLRLFETFEEIKKGIRKPKEAETVEVFMKNNHIKDINDLDDKHFMVPKCRSKKEKEVEARKVIVDFKSLYGAQVEDVLRETSLNSWLEKSGEQRLDVEGFRELLVCKKHKERDQVRKGKVKVFRETYRWPKSQNQHGMANSSGMPSSNMSSTSSSSENQQMMPSGMGFASVSCQQQQRHYSNPNQQHNSYSPTYSPNQQPSTYSTNQQPLYYYCPTNGVTMSYSPHAYGQPQPPQYSYGQLQPPLWTMPQQYRPVMQVPRRS